MKDTINKLGKRYNDLDKSLALHNWIPGIFDGPNRPKTQLVSRPNKFNRMEVYKMIVTNAKGEVKEYPIDQVPDALLFQNRPITATFPKKN
jgi:hypothetical protein